MYPLASTRQILTWLSMCPAKKSATSRQRSGYFLYTLAIATVIGIGFVTSVVYCFQFISIDFDGAAFAFQIAIGEFGLIYFMIAAIGMRHRIANIFTSLSKIYKNSKFNFDHQ